MFSNRYIFIYSSAMVIIVAALLSSAAMILKPFQERNIAIAKIQGILAAADKTVGTDSAEIVFNQIILKEIVLDQDGNETSVFSQGAFEKGSERAFDINLKTELYNKSQGRNFKVPLYLARAGDEQIFILPLYGKGLWGPVYGNIALKADMNTVFGAEFGHDKETPGLGAEIALPVFGNQFRGKTIFNEEGEFVSIIVKKGGVTTMPPAEREHGVDAISGGTITSDGVTKMIENCLSNYVAYFKSQE